MKKTVLIGILALACSASFAQSLDQQIDAAVAAKTGESGQDAQAKAAEHARNNPGNHQLRVDSTDSRIVEVNGKKFYLRKSGSDWLKNQKFGLQRELTFVSEDNDTVQVVRKDNFESPTPYFDCTAGKVDGCNYSRSPEASYTTSSSEVNYDGSYQIVGAEKQDGNGNTSYVVEAQKWDSTPVKGKKAQQARGKYDNTSTTVTVKQHNIRSENARDIKGGTYQGVLATPDSTWNRSFQGQRGTYKVQYGPESYYK